MSDRKTTTQNNNFQKTIFIVGMFIIEKNTNQYQVSHPPTTRYENYLIEDSIEQYDCVKPTRYSFL